LAGKASMVPPVAMEAATVRPKLATAQRREEMVNLREAMVR